MITVSAHAQLWLNFKICHEIKPHLDVYIPRKIKYIHLKLSSPLSLTKTLEFQILLNIPIGIYQVRFDSVYIGTPGIKAALYNVTLERNLCQSICECAHCNSFTPY